MTAEAGSRSAALAARCGAILGLLALALACRPYFGIRQDARIYVGRAEADLGRPGMANDLMFVHDGQSGFSIFGALFRPVVAWMGPSPAAGLVTAAGLALWLVAAAVLMSRFVRGPQLWAALIGLTILPASYLASLAYAEPVLTPRIFAEAAVCLALACILDRRPAACAAFLAVAGLVHPIMALPAAAAVAVMLVLQDRRWLWLFVPAAALATAAAFAGLPLIGRLTVPLDGAWRDILADRAPYLFPARWPFRDWMTILRDVATLLIAARYLSAGPRKLLFSILVVAVGGVAASAFCPTLLIVQVQPWRALWLAAMLAAALTPVCLAELWKAGVGPKIAAALLLVAWGGAPADVGGGLAATACVLAFAPAARLTPARFGWLAWALAAAAVCWLVIVNLSGAVVDFLAHGHGATSRTLLSNGLAPLALALAAAGLVRAQRPLNPLAAWALLAAALLAFGAAACAWNAQDAWSTAREQGRRAAALQSLLPEGESAWLESDGRTAPWTGRPDWWSLNQGAGAVFDRNLALEWRRRFDILLRAGAVSAGAGRVGAEIQDRPRLTFAGLSAICSAPGGPASVIAPVHLVAADAEGHAAGAWTPGVALPRQRRVAEFLIFRCQPSGELSRGRSPAG